MELFLPNAADGAALCDMMREWRAAGGRINPGLLRRYDGEYGAWLRMLEGEARGEGDVPQTLYFLKAGERLVGAVAIRHYLNRSNCIDGGHVAYGVRPGERGRGYGNEALALAVGKMREMGIGRALITCDADNELSRRVIRKNGGEMENRITDEDGCAVERYWIRIE